MKTLVFVNRTEGDRATTGWQKDDKDRDRMTAMAMALWHMWHMGCSYITCVTLSAFVG